MQNTLLDPFYFKVNPVKLFTSSQPQVPLQPYTLLNGSRLHAERHGKFQRRQILVVSFQPPNLTRSNATPIVAIKKLTPPNTAANR